jgi:hypothetical protein
LSRFFRKRHDDVVIDLRHGIAVPVFLKDALAISVHDGFVDVRRFAAQPGQERGADIEAHIREIIDPPLRLAVAIEQLGLGVDFVALLDYALVPVVERGRGGLFVDFSGPGIFAGRLIKMAVYRDEFLHWVILPLLWFEVSPAQPIGEIGPPVMHPRDRRFLHPACTRDAV